MCIRTRNLCSGWCTARLAVAWTQGMGWYSDMTSNYSYKLWVSSSTVDCVARWCAMSNCKCVRRRVRLKIFNRPRTQLYIIWYCLKMPWISSLMELLSLHSCMLAIRTSCHDSENSSCVRAQLYWYRYYTGLATHGWARGRANDQAEGTLDL